MVMAMGKESVGRYIYKYKTCKATVRLNWVIPQSSHPRHEKSERDFVRRPGGAQPPRPFK